jgi:tetratricopeptide (TPR) repeat protein
MGTVAYMSPEQARGEKLDARTDLFSFGTVLYEMATGRMAFSGNTTAVVFEAILNRAPVPPSSLNPVVPPELDRIISRALEKDRQFRYQSASDIRAELKRLKRDTDSNRPVAAALDPRAGVLTVPPQRGVAASRRKSIVVVTAAALLASALGLGSYFHLRWRPVLTEQDSLVLADFRNTTGEPAFDDTLKQALRVQLEQSPFLNVVSEQKVSETLAYMGRPRDARLTESLAREVCIRTVSKAMLAGSVSSLGSQYVIGLNALSCQTGDSLDSEQAQADSREHVLQALGDVATKMRRKLGESLASVQKYDTPAEQATTSSLEALQAYSLGRKKYLTNGPEQSIPFFRRAVELDTNFAVAYAKLATAYWALAQRDAAIKNVSRAYALRQRVSERERFGIESAYYFFATGQLENAARVYELWQQTYPRDTVPHSGLGAIYMYLGQPERALAESRDWLRLEADKPAPYARVSFGYLLVNRFDEAEAVLKEAEALKFAHEQLWLALYAVAFLRDDATTMERVVREAAGKLGSEALIVIAVQADTEAYHGHLTSARELTQRAVASFNRVGNQEATALFGAAAAHREALFGNVAQARQQALAVLKLCPSPTVRTFAALSLARAGDATGASATAEELHRQYPLDTMVNIYSLPTARAALEIHRQRPAEAIRFLEDTVPYELASPDGPAALYPVYLRGEAYLLLREGKKAAAQFQKILDHAGLVLNFPVGALAHLGLGRARALAGDRAGARSAYQDFFVLWKDADPDIPILKEAKAEYRKLL